MSKIGYSWIKKFKEDLSNACRAAYSSVKGAERGSVAYEMLNELRKIEEGYVSRLAKLEFYKRKGELATSEGLKAFEEFRKFDEKNREKYSSLRKVLENYQRDYKEFEEGKTNMKPLIIRKKGGYSIRYEKVEPAYEALGGFLSRVEKQKDNVVKQLEDSYKNFAKIVTEEAQKLSKLPALPPPKKGE